MSLSDHAVKIESVTHRYGQHVAVDDLSFQVPVGCIFGLLGPNGSGKSTLFRLISTLVPVQSGSIQIFGSDVMHSMGEVRGQIGVVFQSPSIDRKLTVYENIACQAALYGISGGTKKQRIEEVVQWMGLGSKLDERCEKLSGGQKRRVELAKGLLHHPRLLILDEPSTGLDPAARLDLWNALTRLKQEQGTTIILTTHLLEEADKCDQLAILNHGKLVALDTPDRLRGESNETIISITSNEPERVASILKERFGWVSQIIDTQTRVMVQIPSSQVGEVVEATDGVALTVSVGRPSLEDVFIKKTGHQFHNNAES